MNVLFICTANKLRSRTAEDHFTEKYPVVNFMSAGTDLKTCMSLGTTPLEEFLLEWADIIYVMENTHKKKIGKEHLNKVKVLGIPDNYDYNQKELIDLLEKKIKL
jgi:predicted protein tyrosine phosphatase